jgi:hypothetical protein
MECGEDTEEVSMFTVANRGKLSARRTRAWEKVFHPSFDATNDKATMSSSAVLVGISPPPWT